MKRIWLLLSFLAVFNAVFCGLSCKKKQPQTARNDQNHQIAKQEPIDLKDAQIQPYQVELLEFAFQIASAIPIYPHIKDRSREQYQVVEAALKLDQPRRALNYIEGIANWRRGAGYADLAMYCARHSRQDLAQKYLDLANKIAEEGVPTPQAAADTMQEWRRDHIRAKIGQTYAWLDMMDKAKSFQSGVVESEQGKVAEIEAQKASEQNFEQQMQAAENLINTGNLDIQKNAISNYIQLYNRFYENKQKRDLIEEKIKSSWSPIPNYLRIKFLMDLAKYCLEHNDSEKALVFVDEAQQLLDSPCWTLEERIPMAAGLAALRYNAGQTDRARTEADLLLTTFNDQKEKIANIFRAETLIPLAEAYQEMGDAKAALFVYKKAVEEGSENPNARPRAEDISAIAVSMAVSAVEPDAQLWTRMRDIQTGLGNPW